MAEPETNTATYTTSTVCRLLDLTPQRVAQLTAAGVLQRATRGRYHLVPTVRAYVRYLRDRTVGRDAAGVDDDYRKGRARLVRIQADIAELERGEKEADLIPAAEVRRVWMAMAGNMRTRLLAIPRKLAPVVPTLAGASEIEDALRAEIADALEEIARTNVEYRDDKPGRGDDDPADAADDGAAAEADDQPVG